MELLTPTNKYISVHIIVISVASKGKERTHGERGRGGAFFAMSRIHCPIQKQIMGLTFPSLPVNH